MTAERTIRDIKSSKQEGREMKSEFPEGNAIVYCEGAFNTTNGKTAHGLVRRSDRYRVLSVVDSGHAGCDAGTLLDGRPLGIPIEPDIISAVGNSLEADIEPTHLVVGLAPDGGRLTSLARSDIRRGIRMGLHVDSGLHDFLCEDPDMVDLADAHGVVIRDVRMPPPRDQLHFFTGKIAEVKSLKVAVLGTDSAVGKRTTAWFLIDALREAGLSAELVGTGQTAWMQGARYGIILDSLINDFVAGEIEHAVWSAWDENSPDMIVLEGQGSLMNPAYPGGYEILAAGRPDVVILQHAPMRREYDGFPGHSMHGLQRQIDAIETVSGKPVVAITVNHEGIPPGQIPASCRAITEETLLPAIDVLRDGAGRLVQILNARLARRSGNHSHVSREGCHAGAA
jgi:uncharacterized NAD-dependent epimerase/dehydratase family protein